MRDVSIAKLNCDKGVFTVRPFWNKANALHNEQYKKVLQNNLSRTRMWADAQRDGRPAGYVAPSVQRRNVSLTPTTECRAVTLPRREPR